MITSEIMMMLDSVILEFNRAPRRQTIRVTINKTGVEFDGTIGENITHFSIFNSDVRLMSAISRQLQEPGTWNKED